MSWADHTQTHTKNSGTEELRNSRTQELRNSGTQELHTMRNKHRCRPAILIQIKRNIFMNSTFPNHCLSTSRMIVWIICKNYLSNQLLLICTRQMLLFTVGCHSLWYKTLTLNRLRLLPALGEITCIINGNETELRLSEH